MRYGSPQQCSKGAVVSGTLAELPGATSDMNSKVSRVTVTPSIAPQAYGEVFTRRWVVETLLDLVGYTPDRDLGALHLVEPSCGSGAFLGPIVERLLDSAGAHARELDSLADAVSAFDLLPEHVETSRTLCHGLLTDSGVPSDTAAALVEDWISQADFLLPQTETGPADFVVGNPPYIRYDDLSSDLAAAYREAWLTMRGRGDIYVGFFERSLQMLTPAGQVGFICADRWMRNQYGATLRGLVTSSYSMNQIWTMHDVDAFESQVSAYPAITVLGRQPQGPVVIADTTAEFGEDSASALTDAVRQGTIGSVSIPGAQAHVVPSWFTGDELWPTGSPARLALIEYLTERFEPLHDPSQGTKVSIGVATGADRVYVTKDLEAAEPERMLPLAMRRDLMSGSFEWQGNYLVNPWGEDGKLVALDAFPRMAEYLANHPGLKDRHVAKKSPAAWYRTIDKVNASLTDRPKLLIQDMKAHIHPVLEPGGHYPHHNLYYVVSDTWDMEVLGGLLLSRIAQAFIEAYCVRMRGGTLRFQAQYLKRIRIPNADNIDGEISARLRDAFRGRDVEAATSAAAAAYGIDLADYEMDRPMNGE